MRKYIRNKDIYREQKHKKRRYMWNRDTCEDETYAEWRHIQKGDIKLIQRRQIHRIEIYMERIFTK